MLALQVSETKAVLYKVRYPLILHHMVHAICQAPSLIDFVICGNETKI